MRQLVLAYMVPVEVIDSAINDMKECDLGINRTRLNQSDCSI